MKTLIKSKAYSLFNDWVSNAKKVYPDLNYQINDPSVFEKDLEDSINKAIHSLICEEKFEKRKKLGYDYGFICGFVQGNLNALWYNEYIKKQSNEHKIFTAVVVLESYIKFDDLLKIRLTKLFSVYYKEKVNLENLNTSVKIELPSKLDFLETEGSNNPILASLENIKIQMIKNVFDENIQDFLPDLDAYFSSDEINNLINTNPKSLI